MGIYRPVNAGLLAEPNIDLLLTMSIPGRNSTAAILVRTGFVVVLVPVNVPGFRPVLARTWHGQPGRLRVAGMRGLASRLIRSRR